MLQYLGVQNFKAFGEHQGVALSNISLIYGKNSSGKSSLIQSLLLLKQTADASQPGATHLVARGPLIDLGNFKALIYRHDSKLPLHIATVFSGDRDDGEGPFCEFVFNYLPKRKAVVQDKLRVDTRDAISAGRVCLFERLNIYSKKRSAAYQDIAGEYGDAFTIYDDASKKAVLDLMAEEAKLHKYSREFSIPTLDKFNPIFLADGLTPGPFYTSDIDQEYESLAADPNEGIARRLWSSVSRRYIPKIRTRLRRISYLGPMRRALPRLQSSSGVTQHDVGREGQYTAEILARDPVLTRKVNGWLARFEMPYKVKARIIGDPAFGDIVRFTITDTRNNTQMSASDVGFGISQMLPIIVMACFAQNAIICIEQPEIHLHPALQAELADLFIESSATCGNQFIIETHSEHLLLRLQRRIRGEQIPVTNVSVSYVDQDADGAASVRRIRLGASGEMLDAWPPGFFDEKVKEIMADA